MMVGPLPGTVSSTGEVPGQIACAPLGRVGSNPTPGATYSTALLGPRLIRFQERCDSQILCVSLATLAQLNPTQLGTSGLIFAYDQDMSGLVRNKVDHS